MTLDAKTVLTINNQQYTIATNMNQRLVIDATGSSATVYKLKRIEDNESFALKVFRPEYQDAYSQESYDFLQKKLSDIPAFAWVSQRQRLSATTHATLVAKHPELRNAILMPWIDYPTVSDIRNELRNQKKPSTSTSQNRCLKLAQILADTLCMLEKEGLAHGNISNSNVLVNWELSDLHVIDIEDMFHATLKRPITVSASKGGTPSYRFRDNFTSWHHASDRFAGAILISELLTLDQPDCQEQSAEDSYFTQDDLDERDFNGSTNERYLVLRENIEQLNGGQRISKLLEQAWNGVAVAELPTLADWSVLLGKPTYDGLFSRWKKVVIQPQKPVVLPNSNTKIPYSQKTDSDYPVLIVFMLDLSRSMFKYKTVNNVLRFESALSLMNNIIEKLIGRCLKGHQIMPWYHIAVIGYHKKSVNLLTLHPQQFDGYNSRRSPANTHDGIYPISALGEIVFTTESINKIVPIGGDPEVYPDGETHMTQAFAHVHQLISRNLHTYANSHPPYILHITDGANNDKQDVRDEFNKLTSLSTSYGNTLICTAYIADNVIPHMDDLHWEGITDTTTFSSKRAPVAESLREISSHIPQYYIDVLQRRGYVNVQKGTYLFFPGTDNKMVPIITKTIMITTKCYWDND